MPNAFAEPSTRRLLLMRHAKSDWSVGGLSDHERSLNARGRGDAPRMAQWLGEQTWIPDAVLSSTATRTRETISLMNNTWQFPVANVTYHESLYLASAESILNSIAACSLDASSLLVLGHNPGMSYLVSMLARERLEIPTAAIAIFDCVLSDWSQLTETTEVQLIQLIRPKAL